MFIQEIIYLKEGWANVINFDEFNTIETYWTALYVNGNNVIHFNSFGVEHIPKKIKKSIRNKNMIANI